MPFIGHKGKGIDFPSAPTRVAPLQPTTTGWSSAARQRRRYVKFFRATTNGRPIGMNNVRFARSSTFKPVPGKHVAYFRAEDGKSNSSDDITLNFTVFLKKKR